MQETACCKITTFQMILYAYNPYHFFHHSDFLQYQRFRSCTYGKSSLYINEATAQILQASGASKDFSGAADLASWFTTDSSSNITSLDSSQTPVFSSAISNTGDLCSS